MSLWFCLVCIVWYESVCECECLYFLSTLLVTLFQRFEVVFIQLYHVYINTHIHGIRVNKNYQFILMKNQTVYIHTTTTIAACMKCRPIYITHKIYDADQPTWNPSYIWWIKYEKRRQQTTNRPPSNKKKNIESMLSREIGFCF